MPRWSSAITVLLIAAVGGGLGKEDRHLYLVDLAVEHATKTCRAVAREMRPKKGFKPRTRCEAFVDQLEEFVAEGGSNIMRQVDQPMDQVVDAAYHMSNMRELRKNLKTTAQWFLKKKKTPTESETQQKFSKELNQWLLNVATLQKKTDVSALSPQAIRRLREQGVNLPPQEGEDEDEDDEVEYDSNSWGVH
eukprot:TRINITY_DN7463_c0_g1_i1.p1 TRINITY_DN7463_c0_g1~~TRINITY_DN7463_c0_g1_i1.p1  ORF type:complete len:211 (+),score=47.20 TRINITY_DN7463_c0_g1_i1:60-635(+)